MKRPWQIWLFLLLCMAFALPAMCWLTVKALELDRARAAATRQTEEARQLEAEARQQAELARGQADVVRQEAEMQEQISSALWRMDWILTPLIAQEAARPYYVYDSFYADSGGKGSKGGGELVASPLLIQPSPYVLLHFQLDEDGNWASPQYPTGPVVEQALDNGTSPEIVQNSGSLLSQLDATVNTRDLLAKLPDQFLPATDASGLPWSNEQLTINYVGNSFQEINPGNFDPFNVLEDQQPQPAIDQQADAGPQQQLEFAPQMAPNPPPQERGVPQTNASNDNAQQPNDQLAENYEFARQQIKDRGGRALQTRNRAFQSYYQNQIFVQRANTKNDAPPVSISEGIVRPVWIDGHLLLARRVMHNERVLIQGCWLDWEKIKSMLLEQIVDLFPNADLVPVDHATDVESASRLATLPVKLAVSLPSLNAANPSLAVAPAPSAIAASGLSPIQMSLLIAWLCVLLACAAIAILLRGVLTLSERRGAFVSAVTHELRTPLTTFRMYAEMLSEGMVPQAEQRQRYLDTLRIEADRLSHLVENVLSYARLERGRQGKRRELVSIGSMLEKIETRLSERASQADMKLLVEADEETRATTISTDPGAVEQVLFNLVDNACKYAVAADDRRIHLRIVATTSGVELRVRDHGPGIPPHEARRLFRPFSKSADEAATTAPGVGLGLALCRRLAAALDGRLDLVDSDNNGGAEFVLRLSFDGGKTR